MENLCGKEDLDAYKVWLQELQQQEPDIGYLWINPVLDMYLIYIALPIVLTYFINYRI
jgi:hypothetical protein